MRYDKELINTRIENIKDPVQKVLLQDVLKDVFHMVIDYSEDCFTRLEQKIESELDGLVSEQENPSFDIYTGVCRKSNLDETSSFLFPVDTREEDTDGNLLECIFLSCGHDKIKQCLEREWKARVDTEENTYHIKIKLTYSQKYIKKIEWLYRQFHANKKRWKTIHCPYLYKFLDVIDLDHRVPRDEKIKKVVFDLGELNSCVDTDMILVWNIQELSIDTSPCILPGDKAVLYEHKAELPQDGSGYLAVMDENETFYTIYHKDALFIRTETKGYDTILFLKIAAADLEKDNTKLFLPLQSNKKKLRHVDKQAYMQPKLLFTYGEMERILSSYEAYEGFKLESVQLKDSGSERYSERIIDLNCNSFMQENRLLNARRILNFSFSANEKENILLYEKMAFLVSEIQLMIEEYQCVGEFI